MWIIHFSMHQKAMILKPWTISNDWTFQFFVDDCSPLIMFSTMYDAKSTFSDWHNLSQLIELYLSL